MTAPGAPAYRVLMEQLTSVSEELDVRKEEVLILRSQLVSQKEAIQPKVSTSKWLRRVLGDWPLLLSICSVQCVMEETLKSIFSLNEDIIIFLNRSVILKLLQMSVGVSKKHLKSQMVFSLISHS